MHQREGTDGDHALSRLCICALLSARLPISPIRFESSSAHPLDSQTLTRSSIGTVHVWMDVLLH